MKTLILIALISTICAAAGTELLNLSVTARLITYGVEAAANVCCICAARYATLRAIRRALADGTGA